MQYSFAGNAEDILLFRCFRNKLNGFYVDVGAGNPVHGSVTCAFYDIGWRGLNVEPVPQRARELRWARQRDIVVEAAAAAAEGHATLYRTAGMGGGSSLDPRYLDQGYSGGNEEFKIWQISVATRPLSAVLAENNVVDIDFLKIDVEGGEADVLAGLDLRRWRPAVMVLEAMTPTRPPRPPRPNHQRWERTVIDAGYVFVYFDGLNRFYVRKESDELRKHFRIPVSVMDEGRRYRELGNSLMNRSHPHHVFATALARKLLSSFSADELGDAMPIFTRDLSPDFLASLATVEIAATLIRQVFARAPRKDEASDRLSGREITAAQFLSELLGSTEFRMICARVAV